MRPPKDSPNSTSTRHLKVALGPSRQFLLNHLPGGGSVSFCPFFWEGSVLTSQGDTLNAARQEIGRLVCLLGMSLPSALLACPALSPTADNLPACFVYTSPNEATGRLRPLLTAHIDRNPAFVDFKWTERRQDIFKVGDPAFCSSRAVAQPSSRARFRLKSRL